MKVNGRSIYGCTMAEPEFAAPADCRFTQSADGKRLYLHLFAYPFAHLTAEGPGRQGGLRPVPPRRQRGAVHRGQACEHFGEAVPKGDDLLVLELPPVKPNTLVPVIELFLK